MARSHWHIKLTITVISKWWDYEFKFAFGTFSMIMYYCFFMYIICIIRKSNTFFSIVRKKICFRKSSRIAWNWAHIYHYRFLVHCVPYVCWCMFVSISSVQSLSHVRLCDPMNRSTRGFPVHHQLPEFTQTHVHQVSDAIQPSHPLSSPSPPAPNPSQHRVFPMSQLFAWGGQSTGVSALASFLPKNTQDWSLEWTGWISLQSKGLSRVFSNYIGKAIFGGAFSFHVSIYSKHRTLPQSRHSKNEWPT